MPALALLATGVAVTLPASLLLGGSLRANLAYNESGFQPHDGSWNYVVGHYWPALRSTLHSDLTVPHVEGWSTPHAILFYLLCAVLIAGVILLLRRGGDDPFFRLIRGTLPGVVLYIGLAVNYTSLRLEMAFLPALAVGLALLLETALGPKPRSFGRVGSEAGARRTPPWEVHNGALLSRRLTRQTRLFGWTGA